MRSRLILVALAVFVAADILLVALAVRHAQGPPAPQGSTQQDSASATPSDNTSSSSTSSDAPTASIAFLGVDDGSAVVRATRGNCFASVTPEVSISNDQGASFAGADVPGLSEVLGLRVTSQQDLVIIGLGRLCQMNRFTSDDGGSSWSRGPGPGNTWALGPRFGDPEVASPRGVISTPCIPRSVSTVDETLVRVLCKNGQILGTDDVGVTWVTLGTLPGTVDISFASAGEGLALAKRPGCPAAVLRSVDGGGSWSRLACLTGPSPRAIGSQGSVIAAQVGDSVYASSDSGATWSRV